MWDNGRWVGTVVAASQGADGPSLELDELQEADVQRMIKTMVNIII